MNRLIGGPSDDEYRNMWMKSRQLVALEVEESELRKKFEEHKQTFAFYAVHQAFRSPWAIHHPQKKAKLESIFALDYPGDNPKMVTINEGQLFNYIQEVYRNRISKICEFSSDDKILENKDTRTMHSCSIPVAHFTATFVIPPLFGHFLGKANMEAFIEAVGVTFDSFANDQKTFLMNFDGCFLCQVLRQFFFSAVVRPFIGEQFTAFFDFFSCVKKSEAAQYTRLQRFLNLFLTEMTESVVGCPFLRTLFTRAAREYREPEKVIMVVVIHCIIVPMMAYPGVYGVVPLTAKYAAETRESIKIIKYYCLVCSKLPIPASYTGLPPVKDYEMVEILPIMKLVEELLKPGTMRDGPGLDCLVIPREALLFLAEYDHLLLQREDNRDLKGEDIVSIHVIRTQQRSSLCNLLYNRKVKLVLDLMTSHHMDVFSTLTPKMKAIQAVLALNPPDYQAVVRSMDESSQKLSQTVVQLQARVSSVDRMIDCVKRAVTAAQTLFVNMIVYSIYTENNVGSEIEKRKKAIWNDGSVLTSYMCNLLDSFAQKHRWVTNFLPMVARTFHSLLMTHFPFNEYSNQQKQMLMDQKFLTMKFQILEHLEKNGLDECVTKLISSNNIFNTAQMAVMRACLFESPIESARQIVLSLYVIEDLFVFEFGAQPEANQLMPLLANLFISTPIPSPLCFGRWMSHFLQPAIKLKPDWFFDEELRPLEHYFQFNAWVEDMLQSTNA